MGKSIQITLQATGGNAYVMKYPETVELELQLSRSEKWWGVFLSVVETFKAIKEDRDYMLSVFKEWENQGFDPDYQISIDIALNEFEEFTSIYTGFALPKYTDDTLFFTTKFEEIGDINNFLDGTIEKRFDTSVDTEALTLDNNIYNMIAGYSQYSTTIKPLIDFNGIIKGSEDSVITVAMANGNNTTLNNSFASASDNETKFDFIKSLKLENWQKLFFENKALILPKQANVNLYITTNNIIAYGKDKNNSGALTGGGALRLYLQSDSGYRYKVVSFNQTGLTYFKLDSNEQYIQLRENDYNTVEYANFIGYISDNATVPTDLEGRKASYVFVNTGDTRKCSMRLEYFNNLAQTRQCGYISATKILQDHFDLNFSSSSIGSAILNFSILPSDGAVYGQSTSQITINVTDFLEDISKALSVGVYVNTDTKKLDIEPIWEMFTDDEVCIIEDENVFSVSKSLNEFLTVKKITIGTADRNFNYRYDFDRTVKTIFEANNSFSGSLDLSVNNIKAQTLDFIDSIANDIFGKNEADKNEGKYTLFQRAAVYNWLSEQTYYYPINRDLSLNSQMACWSWLLQTISPNGYRFISGPDGSTPFTTPATYSYSPIDGSTLFYYKIGDDLTSSLDQFTALDQKITLHKITIECKLTTSQYKAILNNRDGYITINYKGVEYKGYINNLTVKIGRNIMANLELLEKYEA